MQPAESDSFLGILRALVEHEVDFILVGGLASYLQGVPLPTEDVDIVYATDEDNLERLSRALTGLEAHYVDPARRIISPDPRRLADFRISLLHTRLGRLDVLREIGDRLDYAVLLPRSEPFEIEDLQVRILGLEAIIESKEHADRPKDRLAMMYLREALDQRRRREAADEGGD